MSKKGGKIMKNGIIIKREDLYICLPDGDDQTFTKYYYVRTYYSHPTH
jgi:hypothetical protein